jgi:hypothetical protein
MNNRQVNGFLIVCLLLSLSYFGWEKYTEDLMNKKLAQITEERRTKCVYVSGYTLLQFYNNNSFYYLAIIDGLATGYGSNSSIWSKEEVSCPKLKKIATNVLERIIADGTRDLLFDALKKMNMFEK